MRVLLSSDWRLGRVFHGADLLPEQMALVDQVVAVAAERRVGAVLLAGGLLDPLASRQAHELLEHAFSRLVLEEKIPVVALVPGETASPGRGLLSRVGLHLLGSDAEPSRPVELADSEGSVLVHALPSCHDLPALTEALESARAATRRGARSLLLGSLPPDPAFPLPGPKAWRPFAASCFGGRPGSAELVPRLAFLAGSPLPWGFDDAKGARGLSLLEIDGQGKARSETVEIRPVRAIRRLEGSAAQLMLEEPSADRLKLVVTDEGLVPELEALHQRFPSLLEIDRPAPTGSGRGLADLFAAYHLSAMSAQLAAPERALLDEALA